MPDDDDRLFMHTQPPFRWVTDDEQVMSILLDEDMDSMVYHHHHHHEYESYSKHIHQPAPLTRSMRHDLKKTNIPERLVYHYEDQIIAYLDEQDQDLVMVLDIADSFTRWVVHIMCSYYNLVSFSKCCCAHVGATIIVMLTRKMWFYQPTTTTSVNKDNCYTSSNTHPTRSLSPIACFRIFYFVDNAEKR